MMGEIIPMTRRLGAAWIVLLAGALPLRAQAPTSAQPPTTAPTTAPATRAAVYGSCPPSRDGIGKTYMGREIARVMGHQAADWLDRPEREVEEAPKMLVELMKLQPGDVVADIGAGSGYLTFLMAPRVSSGKVLAVDIQQEMLDLIRARAAEKHLENIEPVLGSVTDPKLPERSLDAVLFVDSYHEFDHPREMMSAIVAALKPMGKVFLVEYRGEDPKVPIRPHHKMTVEQARREMKEVGLKMLKLDETLPRQHVMIFVREEP
jgi:ubiquinone/menaquinone biosynthesis C-methylase UbiE